MSRQSPSRLIAGTAVTAAVLAVGSGTISAHVGIAEGEVTAGSYAILTFGLPHGCGDSPVTELRIQIPEPIMSVTPTRNANWDVAKVMTELDEPVAGAHGESLTERVSEVVYTALTPLADGYRDSFELSLRIPEETAGTTLYFPSVQTCVEGEVAWIEIPAEGQDPHDLDAPSPSVKVVPGDGHGDGHEHGEAHDHDEPATDAAPESAATEGAAESTAAAEAVADSVATDVATQIATEVAAEVAAEVAVEAVPADDSGSNGLAVAALALAGLGVVAGGGALIRSRRS